MRKILGLLTLAAVLTLASIGSATPQGIRQPAPNLRPVGYTELAAYNCGFVPTHDDRRIKYIAVQTIKIYRDGHRELGQLPQVFHDKQHAFGACGAWQDQLDKILDLEK